MARVLRHLLAERWDRYRRELKACRRKFCAESVHESRVAARRLRAALELLAEALDVKGLARVQRALKRHLDLFAPLRDAQVQRSFLPALRLPTATAKGYDAFLRRREKHAARRARRGVSGLKTRRLAKLVAVLDRELELQAQGLVRRRLTDPVGKRFRRVGVLHSRVRADRPSTIHRSRVAFKRFRYSVELLTPFLPQLTPGRIGALRRHQALLGAVQDACVMQAWFAQFAVASELDLAVAERLRQKLATRLERAVARALQHAGALKQFWPL